MHDLHHAPPPVRPLRRTMLAAILSLAALTMTFTTAGAQLVPGLPLSPTVVPKYVEPMPMPLRVPADATTSSSPLQISLNEFQQQLLPASFYATLPAPYNAGSYLWCYKAAGYPQTFPGPTLEARVGIPTYVHYTNNLVGPGGGSPLLQGLITVDQTLHWADPLGQHGAMTAYAGPIPAVTHLHGGEVPSAYDGGPDAWWTPGMTYRGPGFVSDTYTYPNAQQATTLWYHDHALGITRTNVYAGLAGFYLLRDPAGEPANLPGGAADPAVDQYGNPYEREIVIQDRMFDSNGQLFWPNIGINPTIHPFWGPEFFGDMIMVNGKTWPYLQVEPRRYRFRFLNGSNARVYELALSAGSKGSKAAPGWWQIGSDGGLMDAPALLNDPNAATSKTLPLIIAPGERADIIIDFSVSAGRTLTMTNTAKAPYPKGAPADPKTVGQIMQIRVGTTITGLVDNSFNPAVTKTLRPAPIERPAVVPVTRALTLNENMGPGGPLEMFVNNTMWAMGPTETPAVGATEVWEIINLTADTHPIHLHLVEFQLINRQAFNTKSYSKVYGMPMAGMGPPLPYGTPTAATGNKLGGNPDITPHLSGAATLPDVNETGWKDTFRMNPGEVTRVLVRFAPQDAQARNGGAAPTPGTNLFAFNPAATLGQTDGFGHPGGPGYVWHCHIIDHEDNEMMRQLIITDPLAAPLATFTQSIDDAPLAPAVLALAPAKPNPSNGTTRITFSLPSATDVELVVYDLAGREVSRLAEGRYSAGEHAVAWNGQGRDGRLLPNGTYLYRLRTANASFVRKLVMVH